MFRTALVLAGTLLAATACAPLSARSLVDVSVIDRDNGDWLARYPHRGQQWIAGAPGHRYSVRLANTTGRRVLVVLSIDGVNAVTGQTASPGQAGYVLDPWQSTEISGWRKSMDDIAQFVFTDLPDSYAARTGRPDNVGVIGVAVFEESRPIVHDAPRPYPPRPYAYPPIAEREARGNAAKELAASPAADAAAAATGARAVAPQQSLGTGHGDREWSPVSRTDFVRASRTPAQLTQLRYDDYETLMARGVVPRYRDSVTPRDEPRAFPNGFVADPPRG